MKNTPSNNSMTRNIIYYMFYQGLNVIFPFITSMYVARVLLPTVVGNVTYAQNIATYFSILAFLGIPTYGMREIAKERKNERDLSKLYSELFFINLASTVFFLAVYLTLIFSVQRFREDIWLYLITGSVIAFNAINNEWLFSGLEEFSFISMRSGAVKIISFILLVIFVKNPDDHLDYALLTVMGSVGNYMINIVWSSKYVRLIFDGLNIRRHLRPILILTGVNIAIELYSLVDVTMLGIISTPEDVAFYSYGSRIFKIFLQVLNSFTVVIVPRAALFFDNGDKAGFNALLRKTFLTLSVISIPMVCGMMIVSDSAVGLFFGNPFLSSSSVLKLLSPILIISPFGYLLGSRVLLIANKERQMLLCVFLGAIVNIIGNSILIPKYSYMGAAMASVISEITVFAVYLNLSRRYYKISDTALDLVKICVGTIIMSVSILVINKIDAAAALKLMIEVTVGSFVYFFVESIMHEEIIEKYIGKVIKKRLGGIGANWTWK